MILLDTDTMGHLQTGNARLVARLARSTDPDVRTTIITRIELLRGRFEFMLKAPTGAELMRAQNQLMQTEELLNQVRVVPFDEAAATQFERLQGVKGLKKIGRADLLIASIALAHRATLVTRNVRHFQQVPGLRLENWVD